MVLIVRAGCFPLIIAHLLGLHTGDGEYPFLNEIDYQIAVNQTLTEVIDAKTEYVEIALLPPFAGG